MMGYAHGAADLALGKTVDTLRTGDIARRGPDGLFEVVGRSSRFVKMYGLRIDLQRVEAALRGRRHRAFCTDDDDRLVVAAAGRHDERRRPATAAEAAGVPAGAVRAVTVDELPLLSSGKPDYQTVRALAREPTDEPDATDLRALFADVLQIDPAAIDPDAQLRRPRRQFAVLRDDVGAVGTGARPAARRTGSGCRCGELEGIAEADAPRRRWWGDAGNQCGAACRGDRADRRLARRAVRTVGRGAHLLLGVAGYNFGRFCLTPVPRADRVRHLRNTIAWIAVPSLLWVALTLMITDDYTRDESAAGQQVPRPARQHDSGPAVVRRGAGVDAGRAGRRVLAAGHGPPGTPASVRRRCRLARGGYGAALRHLALNLGRDAWFTMLAFWFFAIGWAAAKASTTWQRIVVTVVLVVGLQGYFDSTLREGLVLAGLVLLIWLPAIRCPSP